MTRIPLNIKSLRPRAGLQVFFPTHGQVRPCCRIQTDFLQPVWSSWWSPKSPICVCHNSASVVVLFRKPMIDNEEAFLFLRRASGKISVNLKTGSLGSKMWQAGWLWVHQFLTQASTSNFLVHEMGRGWILVTLLVFSNFLKCLGPCSSNPSQGTRFQKCSLWNMRVCLWYLGKLAGSFSFLKLHTVTFESHSPLKERTDMSLPEATLSS